MTHTSRHYIRANWAQPLCIEIDTWPDGLLVLFDDLSTEEVTQIGCKYCLAALERLRAARVVKEVKERNRGV